MTKASLAFLFASLFVLALAVNSVSADLTVASYSDATCGNQAQSASIPTNQCVSSGTSSTIYHCNSTSITGTIYSDAACTTAIGSISAASGQCQKLTATASMKYTCSDAWQATASIMLIAAVVAVMSFIREKGL